MNTNQVYTDYIQKNGEIRQWHALSWRLQTTLHLRSPPPTVLLSPWGAPLLCSCCHRSCAAPWYATWWRHFPPQKKHLSVMHLWIFCEYAISKTACGMTLPFLWGGVGSCWKGTVEPTFETRSPECRILYRWSPYCAWPDIQHESCTNFTVNVKHSRKKQQANSKKTPSQHHNLFMQQTTRRWSFSPSSWPAADPCSALRDSLALQQGTWRTWVDQDPSRWFWLPTSRKGEKSMVNLMNLMNSNLKKHGIPIHEITSNLMFDDIILSTSLSSAFSMLAVTCIKNLRKFLGFFGSPSLVVFELPNSLKLWAGLRKCSPLKAAGESWPTLDVDDQQRKTHESPPVKKHGGKA